MEQPTRRSTENWRKGVADMEEQGKIKGRNFGRQQTFTQRAAAIHPDLAGGAAAPEAASDGTGEPRRRKTPSTGAAPADADPYGPNGCGA